MSLLRRLLRAFRDRTEAATVAEYGLLIALVAVLLLVAVNNAGASIKTLFTRATCALSEYGAHGGSGGNNGGGNNTGTNPNGSTNNGGGNNTGGGC